MSRRRRSGPAVVAVSAAVAVAAFGGGFAAGRSDTSGGAAASTPPPAAPETVTGSASSPPPQEPAAAQEGGAGHAAGLSASQDGFVLRPATTSTGAGDAVPFRFSIDGPDGARLTAYDVTHEKELHLIVVRRDLAHYQHVHPSRTDDGSWDVDLDLPAGGTYRAFADFAPTGLGRPLTLGIDLQVSGPFLPVALPAPSPTAEVDDYQVALASTAPESAEAVLSFSVSRAGEPVTDLEPYLGSLGHLVALRVQDMAYLHTHPSEDAAGPGGPEVPFETSFPSSGDYRLFLDFQHRDQVRTAEFTVAIPEQGAQGSPPAPPEAEEAHGGHEGH